MKLIKPILLAFTVLQGNIVLASGIPTVDVSAIAQAVLTLEQLKQTYDQIIRQYNQAVSTYQNFTGNRGMGMIYYNPSLRSFLPTNLNSVLRNISINGVSSLSSEGKKILDEQQLLNVCNYLSPTEKIRCQSHQAVQAEFQAALKQAQGKAEEKYDNILELQKEINSTQDAKAIAELTARIESEKATLDASYKAAELQIARAKEEIELREENEALQIQQQAFKRTTPEEKAKLMEY